MGSTAVIACALVLAASVGLATASIGHARRSARRRRDIESRYTALMGLAADAVIVYRFAPGRFGRIVEANDAACRMFGRSREELLATTPEDLLAPGTARLHRRTQRLLPVDRPTVRYVDVLASDGSTIHVEASVRRFAHGGAEYAIVSSRDVGERLEREQDLIDALAGRETLLREIHHRVKNNLQTISSLMNIRMLSDSDPKLREALREMSDRVHAMGYLHRMLYEAGDFEAVDLRSYTQMLSRQVWSSHASAGRNIAIAVDSDSLMVDLDTALPFGLILNEAITNSLKHAFPDNRSGRVDVSVKANDEQVRLSVEDDGVGMQMPASSSSGMGTRMIGVLARQLDGEACFVNGAGTTVSVSFPLERAKGRP